MIILIGTIIIGPNIYEWNEKRNKLNQLLDKKHQALHEADSLDKDLFKRINNNEYIETLAYRDFQLVKDGEKIFRIRDTKQVEE